MRVDNGFSTGPESFRHLLEVGRLVSFLCGSPLRETVPLLGRKPRGDETIMVSRWLSKAVLALSGKLGNREFTVRIQEREGTFSRSISSLSLRKFRHFDACLVAQGGLYFPPLRGCKLAFSG